MAIKTLSPRAWALLALIALIVVLATVRALRPEWLGIEPPPPVFVVGEGRGAPMADETMLIMVDAPEIPSLQEMAKKAKMIVEVEILDKRPVLREDGLIETVLTVQVITPLKNSAPSTREIRIPGGKVADRQVLLAGMPKISAGDRFILFLSGKGPDGWRLPIGLRQGIFRVDALEAKVARHLEGKTEIEDYGTFLQKVQAHLAQRSTSPNG